MKNFLRNTITLILWGALLAAPIFIENNYSKKLESRQIVTETTGVVVGCQQKVSTFADYIDGSLIVLLDNGSKYVDNEYKGPLFAIGDIVKIVEYDFGDPRYLFIGRKEIFIEP